MLSGFLFQTHFLNKFRGFLLRGRPLILRKQWRHGHVHRFRQPLTVIITPAPFLRLFLISKDRYRISVVTDNPGAMPGQGSTSMFSFGKSAGKVEGVLATLSIPFMQPTPQSWKRRAGALKKEKDFTRTLAIQLYPAYAELFERKKDVGRADAVLIARYGE